jgi:pimeloyl-ACP methyl ester carboxylesterase
MATTAKRVDREVFRAGPPEGSTAIVAFSAAGVKPGSFHLLPHLKDVPGCSKLFVRDPESSWYNGGLPGVGRTIGEIAKKIELELDKLDVTRVVTIGPSMGGYAAILFGCMLEAERAIGVVPQTLLDRRLRHAPSADVDVQVPDLKPIVWSSPRTRVDVVAGWEDPLDVFHARRIAGPSSVRILAVPYRLHKFGRNLSPQDRLNLPRHLIEVETPEYCRVNPAIDSDSETRIAATAYAEAAEDWQTVAERIRPVVERYPDWACPGFALTRALARMRDWEGAAKACSRVLQSNPDLEQARHELAKIAAQQGTAGAA